jgi:methionine-rich copper-binding protein CopC
MATELDRRGCPTTPPAKPGDSLTGSGMLRARLVPWVLVAILFVPVIASAHASLVKSLPARRATVDTPPPRVQLWFNERLEPAFSRLSVWDARKIEVDLKDVQVAPDDPKQLSVGIPALGAGVYTVRFRVLSVDGHVVESEFAFTVRGPR